MSQKEFQRVKVIENAAGGRLSVREASRLLQLSERQVQRLKRRYRPDSIGWVQHGNRGRSMPWALSVPQKQLILTLARGKYQGFNDSHLTEKLRAEEDLAVSRETVRRILRAAKLASPQKRRPRQYRSRRPPRPRFGMMALTDASRHDWLEGRGPTLTLIGFQDDATSQILAAHFQLEPENTVGYLRALARHDHRPRHSAQPLPRPSQPSSSATTPTGPCAEQLAGKQSPTQLGRALEELGIQQIPAYSPQAKGRIERAWRTCQDRLVSELRLARATTCRQANAVLARFCADYNRRFARPAAEAACDFRRLPRSLRSRPLPQLALSTRRRRRSHHHSGRAVDRAAASARPSRLRRRNRRTLPSPRRQCCASIAETLSCSRRPSPLRRTRRAPSQAPLPPRRNEKRRASTTSPAAPLWRPLLNR